MDVCRMTEALHLFPLPPSLTDRQQRALDAITATGYDGLTSDELGQALHQHVDDTLCEWCGSAGHEVGNALRAKELVKQRRRKAPGGDHYMVWITVDAKPARDRVDDFPEGF
jgi:hypothetical protein